MTAYPETLLPDARSQLADATDYAVIDMALPIDEFFALFAASDFARRIERGDRATILGISGIELAQSVLALDNGRKGFKVARESLRRTSAYWSGWILSYYQWKSNRTFKEILAALPGSVIEKMHGVFHEAPDERFASVADEIVNERHAYTTDKVIHLLIRKHIS